MSINIKCEICVYPQDTVEFDTLTRPHALSTDEMASTSTRQAVQVDPLTMNIGSTSDSSSGDESEDMASESDEGKYNLKTRETGTGRAPKKIFICVCRLEFSTRQKALDHIRSVHSGDRYVCSICYMANKTRGVWFTTSYSLLRHCRTVKHGIPDIIQLIPHATFQAEEDYKVPEDEAKTNDATDKQLNEEGK